MPLPIRVVWIGGPQPEYLASNVERARAVHPDRLVEVIGDEVLWDTWGSEYDRQSLIGRADLLKLSIARRSGCWVLDADVWCFRPLDIYETIRPPSRGWWGTSDMGHFGADETFAWDIVDELLPLLPVRRNAIYDAIRQMHAWSRGNLFDVVQSTQLVLPAHHEASAYARLLNSLPVAVGTRLLLHGHRCPYPIADSAVI